MPKYRKKPIVVEAVKITRPITIETSEGSLSGQPGDYLITEANGEQYTCKADIFEKTYEPVKGPFHMKKFLQTSLRKLKNKTREIYEKS